MKRITTSDLWKSPVIKKRLFQEACFEADSNGLAEKQHYWCLVPQADTGTGTVVLKNYEEGLQNADPHVMQQNFAHNIMQALQKQAHFDGLWLVGFTHPPSNYGVITDTENCWYRMICIWFDEEGDPQYTLESDLPFIMQLQSGEEYYVGLAHQAHEQWREIYGRKAMKRDMMLQDGQTKAAAMEALKK